MVKEHNYFLPFPEPKVDSSFDVLYEDNYIFAINKSSNLPVHPAGRYRKNNLSSILNNLLDQLQNSKRPLALITNRIDRETSGIVLFAKDKKTANFLNKLFSSHNIKKKYIVYVEGSFPDSLLTEGYITRDPNSKIRKKKMFTEKCVEGEECWKSQTTFYKIEEKHNISKLFATPITGRIHQIRATLCSLGFPIVGDKIYGKDENAFLEFIKFGDTKQNEKEKIQRQALHSFRMEFLHPITKKDIIITAPEPKDLLNIFF